MFRSVDAKRLWSASGSLESEQSVPVGSGEAGGSQAMGGRLVS